MEDARAIITISPSLSPDCVCDGVAPWCATCVVTVAMGLRLEHGETVSVSMLKRRIPLLTGRQASLVLEATKLAAELRPGTWPATPLPPEDTPQLEPPKPEPAKVVLSYTEAETLAAIRKRPGITTRELAEEMGLARTTIKSRVKMLSLGEHVRRNGQHGRRLYPAHDRPIGQVRPREKTRWRHRAA